MAVLAATTCHPHHPHKQQTTQWTFHVRPLRDAVPDATRIEAGEAARGVEKRAKLTQGRDHDGRCFTTWIAGGGFVPGIDYGQTDDHCYNIVTDPVHIYDWNARVLHCPEIDRQVFSVKRQGLDVRLTGVDGAKVIPELLASTTTHPRVALHREPPPTRCVT